MKTYYILKISKKGTSEIILIPFSLHIPNSIDKETVSLPTILITDEFFNNNFASSLSINFSP